MVETLQKSIQESTGIEETAKAEQEEFTAAGNSEGNQRSEQSAAAASDGYA